MLQRITLNSFKSIKSIDLEFSFLNVLIGANGAGKSNLISFFKLLSQMSGGRLQQEIGTTGRAQSILHFGPKVTPQVEAQLEFDGENGTDIYTMRLVPAAGDTLVFAEETLSFLRPGEDTAETVSLGAGHQETRIGDAATAQTTAILGHFANIGLYHFHDTSPTARVRQYCYVDDKYRLLSDAGNLAAFLLRLREENGGSAYRRIVSTIRLIAPFFHDFELEPTGPGKREVILNWRHKESDQLFGPHQLSDGTLRAICLITLLLQPEDQLPELIIVDEPELGLHPYALNIIAGEFGAVSLCTQVIISTQSSIFLDNFDPEDVIVVNRVGRGESEFKRLDPSELEAWLEEYSLGQIWEKNVIGGGPH